MNPDSGSLEFTISWDTASPTNAAEATWGALEVAVSGQVLWGHQGGGLTWSWIELLEWLAQSWFWIANEEGGPPLLPVMWDASRPGDAYSAFHRYVESLPPKRRAAVHGQVTEYLDRHDLARGVQGAAVPSVFVLREGDALWVAGRQLDLRTGLGSLETLGEKICERIQSWEGDERGQAAIQDWKLRDDTNPELSALAKTGMAPQELRAVMSPHHHEWLENELQVADTSEFLVAARLTNAPAIPTSIVDNLAHLIRHTPQSSTPELDELSELARGVLQRPSTTPHEQGYALARWLREQLSISAEARLNPQTLLESWKVPVQACNLIAREIEAFAVWGPQHGPALFVNQDGVHSSSVEGRNATLAHEICHLLVDRHHGLPLAEVLGGRVPQGIERRARAFAAELLAPRATVGRRFANDTVDPVETLTSLVVRLEASREVIAWQARNSDFDISTEVMGFLRSKVTNPNRF